MGRIIRLPRRTFLRGIGGVALALPALEIMSRPRSARAATGTPRFLTSYVGTSVGRAYSETSGGPLINGDRMTPDNEGAGYDIKQALQPIGAQPWQYENGFGGDQPAFDVRDVLTIVSGLVVPWGPIGSVPPGGRSLDFHNNSVYSQISGAICEGGTGTLTAPTIDQLLAQTTSADKPSLAYRVQASAGGGNSAAMSWKRDGNGGAIRVDPVVNPGLAWESLFTNFTPPDPAEAAKLAFELQQRRTVLDLIGDSAGQLLPRLGHADKLRLEQHFDEIRALEARLGQMQPPTTAQCVAPTDPGDDWPESPQAPENEEQGWSNEELRAEVFTDLIHMAFVCDLSRVASLMFGAWKSYLSMAQAVGYNHDLHGLSHFGGAGTGISPLSDGLAWHVKHYARLIRKLADTLDEDGTPVLDHSVLTMIFEGGWGFDPDGTDGPHSTENMVVLVAGGKALGLTPGRHIRGDGAHPASVLLAAANACGYTGPLGDIDEPFSGL